MYKIRVNFSKFLNDYHKIALQNQLYIMTFDKKSELNILINLAASDNKIEDKEAKLIHTIAKANGISKEEVEAMIKNPKTIHNLGGMTQEEKFEHLYYLIQLMKMDGQVFRSEIIFI